MATLATMTPLNRATINNDDEEMGMSRGSYTDALSRFNAQTEELKRLLADEGEVVSTTSQESEDEDSGSEEEDDDDDDDGDDDDDDEDEDEDSSDYEDSDDEDSDWDSELDDLEAVLQGDAPPATLLPTIQQLPTVRAVGGGGMNKPFHKSSPALMAMDISLQHEEENVLPGIIDLKDRMRRASGSSYLQSPEYMTKTQPETVDNPFAATKPDDYLRQILEGFSATRFPSETWHDYFLKMTDAHVEAHTTQVEQAIRAQDYKNLREMLRQGHTLQTCNKHGESIVHIACRRGTVELLEFLFQEAGVSPRIRDDVGRTPLHDCCWTHTPNFDLVMLLLKEAPELLFITDHRGATPLTYIPREAWGVWNDFLQQHRQFLRDMVKSLRYDRAKYFVKNMVPCLQF